MKNDVLRRRPPSRTPYPRFLIVCEGEVTETRYLKDLRHIARVPVELVIESGGTPRTLVEKAASKQRDANRAAKFDSSQRFDEVWCVFDIDSHPFIEEAKQRARDNLIAVAVSNPCFELWVLLHFQDQNAFLERAEARRLCRSHLPTYRKELPIERLMPTCDQAISRAKALEVRNASANADGANPSTQMHHLVKRLLALRDRPVPSRS